MTPMVKRILIANGVVFLLQRLAPGEWIAWSAISVEGMLSGMLWQPFTYMWLHGGLMHVFFNMFALWMFGPQLEMAWGSRRFLRFYLICGVGAGFVILVWNSITVAPEVLTLGASGAIFGVLTGFSLLWPDRTVFIYPFPVPIRAIWFIPLLFMLQIAMGGGYNVSHAGHLGGVLVAGVMLRRELTGYLNLRSLRYRWHRFRMRNRLRAVRREDWERRRKSQDDDDRPTFH